MQPTVVSKASASHYTWGSECDGWYLVRQPELNIIQERMPPGTAETWHQHGKSRQFFFVLSGSALMQHGDTESRIPAGSGLEIPPGVPHRILNDGVVDLEFLVTSQPPSHGDRTELNPDPVANR